MTYNSKTEQVLLLTKNQSNESTSNEKSDNSSRPHRKSSLSWLTNIFSSSNAPPDTNKNSNSSKSRRSSDCNKKTYVPNTINTPEDLEKYYNGKNSHYHYSHYKFDNNNSRKNSATESNYITDQELKVLDQFWLHRMRDGNSIDIDMFDDSSDEE